MRLGAHGLSIELPGGWEGRIFRRGAAGPVLHAASFALHEHDGDFGAAATGRMRDGDRFLAVVEYRPDERLRPGQGLFESGGPPQRIHPLDFSARQLQVTRAGQLGWQRFFTASGRACCAYAVIRPGRHPPGRLVAELARVLATLTVEPGFAGRAQPTG